MEIWKPTSRSSIRMVRKSSKKWTILPLNSSSGDIMRGKLYNAIEKIVIWAERELDANFLLSSEQKEKIKNIGSRK